MVDDRLEPEELTTAGLPSARRGYDRKAVSALLEEAARRWAELRDHHREIIDEISPVWHCLLVSSALRVGCGVLPFRKNTANK